SVLEFCFSSIITEITMYDRPMYIPEENWCSWCDMDNKKCKCSFENTRIWFEVSDYCKSCYMFKSYCYCGAIVGWRWEDVENECYKWCKYCDEVGEDNKRYKNRANHNSRDCKYKPSEKLSTTDGSKLTEEWKMEKIECSICSTKKWIKRYSKGQRCPKSKKQIWNDCWLDIDELGRNIFTL
ncbi:15823_t:CDS:2, partial [Dentiscutata heterogama]